MNLASYIKSRRQNIGYSQEKLAELVGVYRHQIIRWENEQSEPTWKNFVKLCEVLGMELSWFVEKESEDNDR